MKEDSIKGALENIAQRGVPENINLWPPIGAQMERKSLMRTLHTRPALMIVIAILTVLLLSGVAYAIGKVTGYIPGIGMVDQSAPLRVLAEPVIVTRDGIILTVEQVVLSADKTVLTYKVEGIPEDAYPHDENIEGISSNSYSSVVITEGTPENSPLTTETSDGCIADVYLRLPNGSTLGLLSGQGSGWMTGFENRVVYDPISADVNEVTLLMSCVEGTRPGLLPENWEVPLRFVPAPPNMTILPVVDVAPSALATEELQSAMTIEQVIETDNGYILIGNFRSIDLPMNAKAQGLSEWLKITDANGQIVNAAPFSNIDPKNVIGEFSWGYEIDGKQHAWPLTLTIDSVSAMFYQQRTEFKFDTGPNPQVGQKWILNQDIQLGGYTIRVVSIDRTAKGYSFIFKADPDVTNVTAEIKGFPHISGSGWNDGYGNGDLFSAIEYEREPPFGKLTIELGWLHVNIHGPWQVQWSPENISSTP